MLDEDDMLQHALKLYKHNFDKGVEKSAEDPANFDEKFEKFSMEVDIFIIFIFTEFYFFISFIDFEK
jgi:hypothetical protein